MASGSLFFRSSMLLSTAKASTRPFTANTNYASVSRRTISSTRSTLNENQNQYRASSQSSPLSETTEQQQTQNPTTPFASADIPHGTNQISKTTAAAHPPSLRQYPYALKTGTVTSVGLMDKTVRVAYRHREWDRRIRKAYPKTTTYLVSDPRNSLREGDVIEFSSGAPRSRHVRHVVERIIAPFGTEIADRPAVLTREERETETMMKRAGKMARKTAAAAANTADSGAGQDAEKTTTEYPVQSKDHIGRIRSLVLERTAAGTAI